VLMVAVTGLAKLIADVQGYGIVLEHIYDY
jgi:hypothetical protein